VAAFIRRRRALNIKVLYNSRKEPVSSVTERQGAEEWVDVALPACDA
jgi:hypothetical protein